MPSRKRSQGRARKVKASGRCLQQVVLAQDNDCEHGRPSTLPRSHVCHRFMDDYVDAIKEQCRSITVLDAVSVVMTELLKKYPEVHTDDATGKLARAFLLSSGAMLLKHKLDIELYPAANAGAILLLEQYCDKGGDNFMKYRDVTEVCERSIMKFFSARIPCSCLDKLYAEVKEAQPKTGFCDGCYERKERSALMICTACKAHQYCSTDCQLTAWPGHKKRCKELCQMWYTKRVT